MSVESSSADWTDNVSCFLQHILAASESEGQHSVLKSIRSVCKAWFLAANDARQVLHPQYAHPEQRISQIARTFVNLTRVDLSSCRPRSAVNLQPLLSLTSLEILHVGNYGITVPSPSSQALQQLYNLKWLSLSPLGDLGLFQLSQLQQLQTLYVRGPEVYTVPDGPYCYENETAAMHVLRQAANMPLLQTLSLSRLAVSEPAWEALTKLTQLCTLELCEVMHTDYIQPSGHKANIAMHSTASQDAVAAICKLGQLIELNMPGSLPYLTSIQEVSSLTSLIALDLRAVGRMTSIEGLNHLTALEVLDLSDLSGIQTLSPLQHLTNLQVLRFAKCINIQTWGVQVLSSLRKLSTLDMHCCGFSSSWVTLLTGLNALCDLDMSVGNWRDQDVIQLTACRSLTRLNLTDCPSTTASMHRILKERLPFLRKLNADCHTSGEQYAGFLGWPY